MKFNAVFLPLPEAVQKAMLVMKLTAFLLLFSLLQVRADCFAQKISLSVNDAPLDKVLLEIQSQSGYDFVIPNDLLGKAGKISLHVSNEELKSVLEKCFTGLPFTYSIEDKTIIVKEREKSLLDNIRKILALPINVSGRVTDSIGDPLPGVTIKIKGQTKGTITDAKGNFNIASVPDDAVLVFTMIGFKTREIAAASASTTIVLQSDAAALEQVTVSTGYQQIAAERMTGSYVQIDNDLFNRRVSTDLLDRIDGITSGLIFNKVTSSSSSGEPAISIRGRSTINANAEPLIVLDNFPYDGNLSDINPNDVENITVLKDAAAASVWGAFSGNGVIVITTKQGRHGQKPKVSVTANTTVGEKPNLHYTRWLSSSEAIEVEKFLYDRGAFTSRINNAYQSISPAVTIFDQMAKSVITEADGERQLDILRNTDIREQQEKYMYQNSLNQQYNLNVQGGSQFQRYYLSAGYDRTSDNLIKNTRDRYTVNAKNSYSLLNQKLDLTGNILFTNTQLYSSEDSYSPTYPYESIADESGNPLAVTGALKPSFIEDATSKGLLDWRYIPLEERYLRYRETERIDYRINLSADYKVLPGLKAGIQYQYGKGVSDNSTINKENSYYTRNQINLFTQVNAATGALTRPIPLGDIRSEGNSAYTSQYGRAQLNYDRNIMERHHVTAFAAFEVKDLSNEGSGIRYYGYDDSRAAFANIDYQTSFRQYTTGSGRMIEYLNNKSSSIDRFRSYIGNLSYTYDRRYTLYGSLRRDESNLFGVSANQKGVPLWSVGGSWTADAETFYNLEWLPSLKLRLTLGSQGNIDKSISAYLTAIQRASTNTYGDLFADLVNPPNPSLRWEKVNTTNVGVDFALKADVLNGTIDFFRKNAKDLIGNSPIAPQTGLTSFRGNVADMRTQGIDIALKGNWTRGSVRWSSDILYSFVKDKITKYEVAQTTNLDYMRSNYVNPFEGRPYSALFSFPYAGLDEQGNPQGYLNGEISTDYTALTALLGEEYMRYHGTQVPTSFGSIRNSFSFKNIELSFNAVFKFNYYFRRLSLANASLYSVTPFFGMPDYDKRWKEAGDELTTTVPALIYSPNSRRDNFYQYSDVLVEKGDHIRLQDIQLSYSLSKKQLKQLPVESLKLYLYMNNIGILWRANDRGFDPDVYQNSYSYPAPKTISFGISLIP